VAGDLLDEIGHFFEVCKDMEHGKGTEVVGWRGRDHAGEMVAAGIATAADGA
jgi:inorganic pyrophosphatase